MTSFRVLRTSIVGGGCWEMCQSCWGGSRVMSGCRCGCLGCAGRWISTLEIQAWAPYSSTTTNNWRVTYKHREPQTLNQWATSTVAHVLKSGEYVHVFAAEFSSMCSSSTQMFDYCWTWEVCRSKLRVMFKHVLACLLSVFEYGKELKTYGLLFK